MMDSVSAKPWRWLEASHYRAVGVVKDSDTYYFWLKNECGMQNSATNLPDAPREEPEYTPLSFPN